ncbi:MAG: cobalamin-dependent protein [Bacillota bacterium]
MDEKTLLEELKLAVAEGEEDVAIELVKDALARGMDPLEVLNQGAIKGMEIVGERYNQGEAFLPELVISGDTMTSVLKLLFSSMSEEEREKNKAGVVVIGQAKGDVHDIGKNIVVALLAVNGFEVHDLGTDVEVKLFAEKTREVGADIVGVSTLLTTSLPYMMDTVKYFQDTGLRGKVHIIFGGGPVTPEFVKNAGANGWARSAIDCVAMCKQLMQLKPGPSDSVICVDARSFTI